MIGSTELIIIGILAIFLFGAKESLNWLEIWVEPRVNSTLGFRCHSPSSAEIDMDRGGVSDDVANENE